MTNAVAVRLLKSGSRVCRLSGGPVWTPGLCLTTGEVEIRGDRIARVGVNGQSVSGKPSAELEPALPGTVAIDVGGALIVPGLLDVHMHGAGGGDALYGDPDQAERLRHSAAAGGAAGLVVVIPYFTDDVDLSRFRRAVRVLLESRTPGSRILGIHLETPFINPAKRGGFPPNCCHPIDLDLFRRLLDAAEGSIRVMTLAPELPGMEQVIEMALAAGVRVSLGHSAASAEVARRGFALGADRLTHTFNAMDSLHHREIGLIGAAFLDDDVYLEVIADGIHLAPDTLLLLGKMFSARRLVGITDSNAGAGMPEGTPVRPVGGSARVKDGAVRLDSGVLAGSVVRIAEAMRNLIRWAGLPPRAALECVTLTAAQSVGIDDRVGSLEAGKLADVTVLERDTWSPLATIVGGEVVWSRTG